MSRKVFPGKQTGGFWGLRLSDSPPTLPSCAGTCLPSQILNKTRKIKGIPNVHSAFSMPRPLLYKYWKPLCQKSGHQSKKGGLTLSPFLYLSLSFSPSLLLSFLPQREEKRLCEHDTAGGPHAVTEHHLLHHTICLRRSGEPQSTAPQQVGKWLTGM